jgi:hypothetical protein
MRRIRLILAATGLALATTAAPMAVASWPNGPDEDPTLAPPNDPGFKSQWNLWSSYPADWKANIDDVNERDNLGPGLHADRAWQVTTGDRRVIIAVHDSGAYWDNRDLVNKYYLHRPELGGCKPTPLATPPAGADAFDVDGSGWFDIRDYYAAAGSEQAALAEWDTNRNGMLDPQDLLKKCSDGVDDDGNGYVDDISGWDFFRDDNDAHDDTAFGHGNGEARDSAAEGNNGMGDIGVCPDCSVLMIRVGDSFVTDSNEFAHGVVYSTDVGAHVIQSALGTVNYTEFAREALAYAYANNVAAVTSAADELSFHHNYPGSGEYSIYVHAIMFDEAEPQISDTFLNFNNCTNYGMQLLLSAPGTGCSSESVGVTSGHVGLIYAAALEKGLSPPLSAEEVKQILVQSVDDIAINPNDNDPEKYRSGPGFDWHFGYGRTNARKSVDMVLAGQLPPEVYIEAPSWFQVIDPDRTPKVPVTCRLNQRADGLAARYAEVRWVLEYATGVDPNSGFVELASGTTSGRKDVCAEWDVTKVPFDYARALTDPHQFAVTLRLRAEADLPGGGTVKGEHRKGFIFHKDPTAWAAFPLDLGTSAESSPIFANLDGDNDEEIVIFTSDGRVHAYQQDGTELAGFPVTVDQRRAMQDGRPGNHRQSCAFREDKTGCVAKNGRIDPDVARQNAMMPLSVGDLEGDGDLEIVLTTWDGAVFIFEHDGTRREGWPQSVNYDFVEGLTLTRDTVIDSGFFAAPVLYDLDGEPGLEIIAAAMDQHIYVWHADGSPMAPYPVRIYQQGDPVSERQRDRIVATPAVGDLDGDGDPEIATGSSEVYGAAGVENEATAYVIDGRTGEVVPGWPRSLFGLTVNVLPVVGRGVVANPMLADLDFDGTLEVSFDTISTQGWLFRHDGTPYKTPSHNGKMNNQAFGPLSDSVDSPAYILMNNGAFANIDGEGGLDMVKGTAGFDFALAFAGGGKRGEFDHHMSGWDTDTGRMMEGFPRIHDDWQFFNSPTVADLDNDTNPEVIVGSGGYLLQAWNYKGEKPAGFPKQTGGWIIATPAVGDFDGDKKLDVAISTRDGWLFAWKTEGEAGSVFEWNGFGANPHRTGNYEDDPVPYRTWDAPEPGPDATPEAVPDAAPEADAGNVAEAAPPTSRDDDGGCAGGAGGALWLSLGALAALRRRRV